MQQITIPVTDKQHSFLSRVAKENRRTLSQVIYLMIETGHCLGYECMSMNVDKTDDEISQEDKDQIAINDKIKKEHPDHSYTKWEELGYKHVCTHYSQDMAEAVFRSIGDLVTDTSPLNEG
tara:strand:+ start:141 stop:503 length:363 start_codon:yes stop_codon:yes gene_type:complete